MFEWLWHFLAGWVQISADACCRTVLADLLWQGEIPFWRERVCGDCLYLRIFRRDLAKLCLLAEETGLCVTAEKNGGLPVVLAFCRNRPGLVCGGAFLLAWCLYSQNLIWRLEIDGCETMDRRTVEEILTEAGCGVGDFVPNIDFDALHAKVKAENPDIAWLSVYMHGTTAEVQMRETKHPADLSHPDGTYANVIASEAGEIVSVRVYEGQAAVQAGDVVLPGELLISGVVDGKEAGSARTEYAAGEVLARVCRPISVEVSCIREKTVYTGRETVKKSVKFFKNTINLFGNTGIPYATYDTIDMMEEVCLFDRFSVPVTIFSTVVRETETALETLTPEEAAAEAMGKLRTEMDRAIGTGEMLSRTVEASVLDDGSCRIDCVLYLLQDIAGTEEFTVIPGAYPSSDIQNQ